MSSGPHFVVLGNPANRRVQLFAEAAARCGFAPIDVVAWIDFLRDAEALSGALRPGSVLRIESSGEDFEVERALLLLGAGLEDGGNASRISRDAIHALTSEPGRILPMRQWYRGWCQALSTVERVLESVPGASVMNAPADIATMFDKLRCHQRFGLASIEVPRFMGTPGGSEELRAVIKAQRVSRIFLKPRHSSSASGVVALEIGRAGVQAFTSLETVRVNGALRLYNSLKVRRLRDDLEIAELTDAICRECCIAEAWFPKAGMDGQRLDLRVLVIAGKAAHTVVRQSKGPMTNLHLGNQRGDLELLKERLGEEQWIRAMDVCEKAAAAFPGCHYVAVDLLIAPSFRRFAVAEVNAFGDLLPRLEYEGMDTYAAEIAAWGNRTEASGQVSTFGV